MTERVMETRAAVISLDQSGICRVTVKPGSEIRMAEAIENVAALAQLSAGRKVPCLIDLRKIKTITRDARVYLTGEETVVTQSASALLIGSPVSKVVGNFFIGINKPPYPAKLFTSEEKALEWLKGFMG